MKQILFYKSYFKENQDFNNFNPPLKHPATFYPCSAVIKILPCRKNNKKRIETVYLLYTRTIILNVRVVEKEDPKKQIIE